MITEDYVSFETAKLLKEKGFDGECDYLYVNGNIVRAQGCRCNWNKGETIFTDYKNECSAPTIQMAMKWLRESYNIFIGINTIIGSNKNWGYEVFIQKQEVPIPSKIQWDWFNTYEEACEVGIRYCLENLI